MPYKNIVFVQLHKRLLNDSRWWTMSSCSQLIYIKLLLLAAETYNKLSLETNVLRLAIRSDLGIKEFNKSLEEIRLNFPNLRKSKSFYYFHEFHKYTNYVRNGQSRGKPKAIQRKGHIDIDIDSNININKKPVDNSTNLKKETKALVKNLAEKMMAPNSTWVPSDRK